MNRWIRDVTLLSIFAVGSADAKPVKVVGATAKSEYDQEGVYYPARYVKDGKASTAWYEGEAGNGLGAWIELDLGVATDVHKVVVYAGDWKSETSWTRANRPKELELKYSDESVETWTLTDEMTPQVFTPKTPKNTSKIRLRIKSVYSGSAFPDTGLSEVMIFDGAPSPRLEATVSASSEFPPDGESYLATNVSDGLQDTYWCEGVEEGDGVGEFLMFDFGRTVTVKTLEILNGMGGGLDLYKKGNAATVVTAQFSDGSTKALTLKPFPLLQRADLGGKTTSSVKLTISAVRKGTDYNDLCISEAYFKP